MSKRKRKRHGGQPNKRSGSSSPRPTPQGAGGERGEHTKVTLPDTGPESTESPEWLALKAAVPDGMMLHWNDEEWSAWCLGTERLQPDEEEHAWSWLQARDLDLQDALDDYVTHISATSQGSNIHSMSDEEWQAFERGFFSEYELEEGTVDVSETTAYESTSKAGSKCTCSGPGSVENKFNSHIASCPEWTGSKYTGGTTVSTPTCYHIRQPFALDDGLEILCSSSSDVSSKYAQEKVSLDDTRPADSVDIGVYVASTWMPYSSQPKAMGFEGYDTQVPNVPLTDDEPGGVIHPCLFLNWPDRNRPSTPVKSMLEIGYWMLDQMRQGKTFETGCIGGHGRTGTMAAVLLCIQGVDPYTAINRVWSTYCVDAIEDASQCSFIVECYEEVHGMEWRSLLQAEYSEMVHKYFTPKPKTKWQWGGV